jgi:hypothetical protein
MGTSADAAFLNWLQCMMIHLLMWLYCCHSRSYIVDCSWCMKVQSVAGFCYYCAHSCGYSICWLCHSWRYICQLDFSAVTMATYAEAFVNCLWHMQLHLLSLFCYICNHSCWLNICWFLMENEVTFVNLVSLQLWPFQLLKHFQLFMICEVTFADLLKLYCKLKLLFRCFRVGDRVFHS